MTAGREVVGVIPAAGHATRLQGLLPCSKEVFPVAFDLAPDDRLTMKSGSQEVLERMHRSGATRAYIVLRRGKWDIADALGCGEGAGVSLAYVMAREPFGVPFTVDAAYPFVRGADVVFGFPDVLFDAPDAYAQLVACLRSTGAAVVLGLFPAFQPPFEDLVEHDKDGLVRSIVIRPSASSLPYGWIIAAWSPAFTEYLHTYLEGLRAREQARADDGRELFVGHVFRAALADGLSIQSVTFPGKRYHDIGTPAGLYQALQRGLSGVVVPTRPAHGLKP
jgi:glucose-1-phosphate thymidylyltransferase